MLASLVKFFISATFLKSLGALFMSVNIMDLVKGAVPTEMMGQLGGLLGQSDPQKTSSIFETAAGSVLGGLMKKATSPGGAKEILGAVKGLDDGILGNLGSILGGGSAAENLMNSGGGLLDMIFGSGKSGMFDALAKHFKLDPALIQKLMKMVAPIVMAVIGKQMKNKSLDAMGLSSLLGEQKNALSGILPASLSSSLGLGNILGSASSAMKDTGAAASRAGRVASDMAGDAASTGSSVLKYLLPLILLGALGWFGYQYFMKPNAEKDGMVDKDINDVTSEIGKTNPDKMVMGNFDLPALQKQFSGITDGFKDVSADNADALAKKIEDLTGSVGDMGLAKLSGTAKTAASGVIGKFIDSINAAVDGISDSGIAGILKPVVKSLVDKLKTFQ